MKTKDKRRRQKAPAAQPPLGRAGAFTPDAISVRPRALEVGGEWVSSFAVVGYPREVHNGWLQPLLTYPGRVDVSLHISRSTPSPRPTDSRSSCRSWSPDGGTPARKVG